MPDLVAIACHLVLALETRGFASVQGDPSATVSTRKLHVPRGSIDSLSGRDCLLTPVGAWDQSDTRAPRNRAVGDLEDHVVSSLARNRYYHCVLGLRVRAPKSCLEQGSTIDKDARTFHLCIPCTQVRERHLSQ